MRISIHGIFNCNLMYHNSKTRHILVCKLIAAIGFIFCDFSLRPSIAEVSNSKLVPLDNLELSSLEQLLYFSQRCSALNAVIWAKVRSEQTNPTSEQQAFIDKYFLMYNRFGDVAFNVYVKLNGNSEADFPWNLSKSIEDISRIYRNRMEANFTETGTEIDELITGDVKICVVFFENLLKQGASKNPLFRPLD